MSSELHPSEVPHRRFNPLTNSHVLVSPHRTKRPWKGQVDPPLIQQLPRHTKDCYLCPGNPRMNGEQNPDFAETYIFENDFPALLQPNPVTVPATTGKTTAAGEEGNDDDELFQTRPTFGSCKVLTYSPRHDLTLALMSPEEITAVIRCWRQVYEMEGKTIRDGHAVDERGSLETVGVEGLGDDVGCVNIFENRGSMMGASAPHPHGQVWSTSFVPEEPLTELRSLAAYRKTHSNRCLLCTYAQQEVAKRDRVVVLDEESGFVALVPFWATWPFEIMVLPYKRHITDLTAITEDEALGLARVLKKVLTRYDNLFTTPFPYSMGIHQAPLPPLPQGQARKTSDDHPAHFHIHFYPPLLRSSSVRKFLVGFEMMAEAQRDLTAEQAAQRLRDQSEVHYTESVKSGEGQAQAEVGKPEA